MRAVICAHASLGVLAACFQILGLVTTLKNS